MAQVEKNCLQKHLRVKRDFFSFTWLFAKSPKKRYLIKRRVATTVLVATTALACVEKSEG